MRSLCLTLVVFAIAGCSIDTSPPTGRPDLTLTLRPEVVFEGDPGWTLEERMKHYGVPGVSVAVIEDGVIAQVLQHGLADRVTGTPVDAETLFQAGSVSKPVAAFGAMTLVQDGALTLDGEINDSLKTWHLPKHEFPDHPVTLTRLLSHTGGLTVHGFRGYAVGEPVPSVTQVLDGSPPANSAPVRVDIEPGSRWRYSGGGYTIAQLMMMDASGQSFPDLMEARVLGPLGMTRSTYENPLPADRLRHAAAGVLPDGTDVQGKRHTYPEMAAAGLWTTAEDLARFGLEVQAALRGKGRVLSQPMAEAMLEPVDPRFGRGFGLNERGGHRYFAHGGWDEGFCALFLASRDTRQGVVVMINSNHPAFMDEVAGGIAHANDWPGYETHVAQEIPSAILEGVPGRYRYNAETALTVYRDGDRLFLQYVGDEPEELMLAEHGVYLRRTRSAPISFSLEGASPVLQFGLDDDGRQSHPLLADDQILPRELLAAGRYDEAVAAYRELRETDPDDSPVSERFFNNVGLDLVGRERFELGIAMLRVATDLYPTSANTWDSLGYAYRQSGDVENAIRNYEKSLEIDPKFPSALAALAELR